MDAALQWHQEAGEQEAGDLRHLKRERAAIGQDAFSQLVTAKVPQDLQPSLTAGIDSAENP
jgi:hypothetical protein